MIRELKVALSVNLSLKTGKRDHKNRYQFFDEEISKEYTRFIKNMSRCCREYKNLSSKYNKKDETEEDTDNYLEPNSDYIAKPHFGYGKDSGKLKLKNLVHESYKMAKKTRTGKGGIRYLTPSPPPVLRKLRNNKSVYSEPSDSEEKPLAYISLINGKTEEIELPSFKDCIKGNRRIDSDSEMVLTRIEKCQEKISNFEKRMNGLEVFCKYNPGVRWDNDKKILMKLSSNQYNRSALIKAYNERKPSSTVSSKRFSVFGKGRVKLPEKPNGIIMPAIEEKGISTEVEGSRSELLQEHCFDGFHQAKQAANCKTLQILSKLRAERPSYLRAKAKLILADDEVYRGKIHSFQKFDNIKKTIEKERYSFVEKCKEQVKVYTRLLDYLKRYKGMPSMQMIGFAEAVKELIEGGWTLTRDNIEGVLGVFNEDEMEDLVPMKEIVEEYLSEMGL